MFLLSQKLFLHDLCGGAAFKYSGYVTSKGSSEYGGSETVKDDVVMTSDYER